MSGLVLAGVLVVALLGTAGLGRAAMSTRQVARVQAVADLVAGAAVVADRGGAQRVAAANGVTLVLVDSSDGITTVEVGRDGIVRRASARPAGPTDEPGRVPPGG